MNTIALFRDIIVAPVRSDRIGDLTPAVTIDATRRDRPARAVLVAVWSRNPATGRLERRWTTPRAAVADEASTRWKAQRHAACGPKASQRGRAI